MKAWKVNLLAALRVALPTPTLWQLENRLQVRAGYIHEPDLELFGLLTDIEFSCLDVGAHRGEAALAALMQAPHAQVRSFEPNPEARAALDWIKRHFAPRFDFELAALGDHHGQATLHVPASGRQRHTASATLNRSELDKDYVRERLQTEAGRAFDACQRHTVPVRRIDDLDDCFDVIKVDVEGSEAAVLDGASRTLRERAPLLIIEFNDHRSFFPMLQKLGYVFYRYDSQLESLVPWDNEAPNPLNLIALADRTRPDLRRPLLEPAY